MMRRSSGMEGARMLRAMGRAVGAGIKEKIPVAGHASKSAAKTPRVVSVSSPTSASSSSPLSKGHLTCFCDEDEWEKVGDEVEFEGDVNGFGFDERCVFGPTPSEEEAEEAVSTIQQIFVPVIFSQVAEAEYSSLDEDIVDKVVTSTDATHRDCSESESDWIEPALHLYTSESSRIYEHERILDAFRLLQVNPPFKRMVTSLSSDPAVWDAVMKNEAVQELKKSFYEAETSESHSSDEDHDIPTGTLKWIMQSTKGKIMEFLDKISKLVNDIFHSEEKGKGKDKDKESDPFDNVLRSSFMLSIVVFIVVVVTRIQRA